MTLRDTITRWLSSDKMPQPITKIMPGLDEKNPYLRLGLNAKEDRRKKIKRYLEMYRRGGPYADAVDAYPLFCLTNGYQLSCEEGAEGLKDRVQDWLDQPHVNLEGWMEEAIKSAIIAGDSYQEIVMNRGGEPWGVVTRDPSSFSKEVDPFGRVQGYIQHIPRDTTGLTEDLIRIDTGRIINLTITRVPGDIYGASVWERAEDDILRDADFYESLIKAWHRHGTPKQQWAVGTDDNPASDADLKDIESEIKVMGSKTDFATTHDVKINMLDIGGIQGADAISNVSLQRVACALGVPEEMLGLGRGSTEATATVRMETFRDKIATIQQIVARAFSRELIDRITGQPGMVWIEFVNVSTEDELKKAQLYALLRNGMYPDAIFPADWCREQFGVPPDEDLEPLPMPAPAVEQPQQEAGEVI